MLKPGGFPALQHLNGSIQRGVELRSCEPIGIGSQDDKMLQAGEPQSSLALAAI
jgi:hypothetical protein